MLLGAHVSTAGGVPEAPPRAAAIEATAMQIFTKMANRWAERDCENDECRLFHERLGTTRVTATMAHAMASQHGGRLEVAPRPGGGTCVTLWLPVGVYPGKPVDDSTVRPLPCATS